MFDAHIPMDRRFALAAGVPLPDRADGAALFADISGFTGLMERQVERAGRQGAEEVARILSRVFDALLRELHRCGGSVIGFAGDAMTCWLDDAGPGPEGLAALRASHVGLAMQRALAELALEEPLELKVSIASGQVRRFLVGDPEHLRLDALAGAPLERMAAGDDVARPGDVVIDRETRERLGERARIEAPGRAEQGEGRARLVGLEGSFVPTPWGAPPRLTESVAAPFVRAGLREHVAMDRALLGDLRLACPVFCRADGIRYEDEGAGEELDALVRWAQSTAASFGGSVHELTIGDKGTYLYLVFGAPTSFPDDPRRAVAAAAVLAASPPPGVQTQLGVSRGRVYAGICGGESRHSYAVMGAEVNVAARLMSRAAPGCVVVTERVRAHTAGTHRYSPLGEVPLRGHARPLPLHRLEGEREPRRATEAERPVGRAAELERAHGLIDQVGSGARRVCVIEGEPGVGKSLLANAVVRDAVERGFAPVVGAAESVTMSTAWRAWRPALIEIFEVRDVLRDRGALRGRVLERMDRWGGEALTARAPLLNALLPLGLEDTELTRYMSEGVRGDNTLELLLQLVEARRAREQPLLLVLDDAHWADASSWRLLERCADELERALILVITRPLDARDRAMIPGSCLELLADPSTARISLGSLDGDAGRRLIGQTLGASDVPDELVRYVEAQTQGHPFFTVELTRALRDAGLVKVNGVTRLSGPLEGADFPDSIEGVITSRIDRLAPAHQQVIKVAAVVGRRFEVQVVEAALPDGTARASSAEALARMEELQLTHPSRATSEDEAWEFRQVITQQVAYERLLFAQRRDLHRTLARFYEARHAEDLSGQYALLAHHYERAEDAQRAVDYLERAGHQALELGAFRECVRFFERAEALAGGGLDRRRYARWQFSASRAWYRMGDLRESREAAERAVAILDRPIPSGARLVAAIADEFARQVRHRWFPASYYDTASDEEREDLRSAVRLYMNLSEVYYLASLPGPSLYSAVRLVNVAERAGPSEVLVEAYGVVSIIAGLVGRHGWADLYARRARELAEHIDTPTARASIRHQSSLYHAAIGAFDRVREDEREASAIYRRLGDIGRLRDALGLLGTSEYLAGRDDEARRVLTELLETQRGDEVFVQKIWGAGWLGALALRRGDLAEAEQFLKQSVKLLDSNTVGLMEIPVLGMLALTAHRLGEDGEARTLAARTLGLIDETKGRPSGHIALDGYVAIAELYRTWGEVEKAAHAAKLLRVFAKAFPIGEPAEAIHSGLLARRAGRKRAAKKAWTRGLRAAERLGMAHERAELERLLSEV